VYAVAGATAGAPCGLRFERDEDGSDGKFVGKLAPGEIAELLTMCCACVERCGAPKVSEGVKCGRWGVLLPDVS
jgi:hypothetical protein